MSYLEPFQSVALFENTFRHQLNKKTGKIDERKFVFDKHFGDGEGQLPVVPDRYRLIWMPGCPHSNKAMITLRLLGLDRVISVGECGVLRDPRGWIFSEDLGGVDPVLKIHYLDDAYLNGWFRDNLDSIFLHLLCIAAICFAKVYAYIAV